MRAPRGVRTPGVGADTGGKSPAAFLWVLDGTQAVTAMVRGGWVGAEAVPSALGPVVPFWPSQSASRVLPADPYVCCVASEGVFDLELLISILYQEVRACLA